MKHEDVKHWLTQPVDELEASVRSEMENHIAGCPSCKKEAMAMERLHEIVTASGTPATEADLSEARMALFRTLRQRPGSFSWAGRLRDLLGLAEGRALRPVAIALVLAVAAFIAGSLA